MFSFSVPPAWGTTAVFSGDVITAQDLPIADGKKIATVSHFYKHEISEKKNPFLFFRLHLFDGFLWLLQNLLITYILYLNIIYK